MCYLYKQTNKQLSTQYSCVCVCICNPRCNHQRCFSVTCCLVSQFKLFNSTLYLHYRHIYLCTTTTTILSAMLLQCIFIRNNMNGRELGQIANELHFTWSGPKEKMQQNIDCFCIILCVSIHGHTSEKRLIFHNQIQKKN